MIMLPAVCAAWRSLIARPRCPQCSQCPDGLRMDGRCVQAAMGMWTFVNQEGDSEGPYTKAELRRLYLRWGPRGRSTVQPTHFNLL
jgi:hypothetical protein